MYDLHCVLQLPIQKSDGFVFAKVSSLEEHAYLPGIIGHNPIVQREKESLLLTRCFYYRIMHAHKFLVARRNYCPTKRETCELIKHPSCFCHSSLYMFIQSVYIYILFLTLNLYSFILICMWCSIQIPKPHLPTKWELFAKSKGIRKTKRSRMVFDEKSQVSCLVESEFAHRATCTCTLYLV